MVVKKKKQFGLKTRPHDGSVKDFLESVKDDDKRAETFSLFKR